MVRRSLSAVQILSLSAAQILSLSAAVTFTFTGPLSPCGPLSPSACWAGLVGPVGAVGTAGPVGTVEPAVPVGRLSPLGPLGLPVRTAEPPALALRLGSLYFSLQELTCV